MIKTIFRNTFLVGILVLLICALLFFGMQYSQTINETFDALEQETAYAVAGLQMNGSDYLESLDGANHITWIDTDGSILYDSEYDNSLGNQKDTMEVADAFASGSGHATRESTITGNSTMYYAKLCEDGTVLRLSRPVSAVHTALLAVSPILWVLVLVLLISGILAFRAAKQIVTPINDLDLDNPQDNPYPELAPLLDKIEELKITIQEDVSSREEMRREFSANVSHELKTPLTSISGFAELMSQGAVSDEKIVEFSTDIYKESQRLISLIDDIIKLSRLDENTEPLEKADVDLYDLSLDVTDSLRQTASGNNISLTVTGKSASVFGVYQLLYEMLFNLCDNAIKYNYPGGSVTVDVSEDSEHVKLCVSDTGIGINKQQQKRVFERFYRVDKSHSQEIGGTGLGLSIVKHTALYHDAKVDLESEEGTGTRVTVTFPKNVPVQDTPEAAE